MPFQQTQFTMNLGELVNASRLIKANSPPDLIRQLINDRIRTICNRKSNWSGLYKHGILFLPEPYGVGSVTFVHGSNTLIGTGTAWPVNDLVSTAISSGISQLGEQWIVPGDMTNISCDTELLVDLEGDPETVTPLRITPTSFLANFVKSHNSNCTVKCSSLTGQQIRTSYQRPIYNITSIRSATELTMDLSYWGSPIVDSAYTIRKLYVTLSPDVKYILSCRDKESGYPIKVNVPQALLNFQDPQRASEGFPIALADMGPLPNGNQGYEVYPPTNTSRQLDYEYYAQPPVLINDSDRPPLFINPSILSYGVNADLLNHRVLDGTNDSDPYYDPARANRYDAMFERELQAAMDADGDKAQTQMTWAFDTWGVGGANFEQCHAPGDSWIMGNW